MNKDKQQSINIFRLFYIPIFQVPGFTVSCDNRSVSHALTVTILLERRPTPNPPPPPPPPKKKKIDSPFVWIREVSEIPHSVHMKELHLLTCFFYLYILDL